MQVYLTLDVSSLILRDKGLNNLLCDLKNLSHLQKNKIRYTPNGAHYSFYSKHTTHMSHTKLRTLAIV